MNSVIDTSGPAEPKRDSIAPLATRPRGAMRADSIPRRLGDGT